MATNHQIFVQQIGIISFGVPVRLPGFINPKSKSYWMNFLSHNIPLVRLSADDSRAVTVDMSGDYELSRSRKHNPNVTGTLPNWRSSSTRTWHKTFERWPFIDHNTIND